MMKTIVTTGGASLAMLAALMVLAGFGAGPGRYQVEIPQDAGGKLVCDVVYACGRQDCQSRVAYSLVRDGGDPVAIGAGRFPGRGWDNDVQLLIVQNHLLLLTRDMDIAMLYVGDITGDRWDVYEFSPEVITASDAWQKAGIESMPRWTPFSTFIVNVSPAGKIELAYRFRISQDSPETSRKLLMIQMDVTGALSIGEIRDA